MKKIFAALLTMMMLLVSTLALAEIPADWQLVNIEDTEMVFSMPADFEIEELTEEDYEDGIAFAAANDLTEVVVFVFEGTLEEIAAELEEGGYTIVANGLAESGMPFDHVLVSDDEDPSYVALCCVGTDGYVYMFVGDAEDEAGYIFGMILASIQSAQ